MGNVCACTQAGRSNFTSLYSPCRPHSKGSGIFRLIRHSRWAMSVPAPRVAARTSSHCTAPAGPAQRGLEIPGSYSIQDGQYLCLHPGWPLKLHLIVQALQVPPKAVSNLPAQGIRPYELQSGERPENHGGVLLYPANRFWIRTQSPAKYIKAPSS